MTGEDFAGVQPQGGKLPDLYRRALTQPASDSLIAWDRGLAGSGAPAYWAFTGRFHDVQQSASLQRIRLCAEGVRSSTDSFGDG